MCDAKVRPLTARELMTPPAVILRIDMPLHEAAELLTHSGMHAAPVVDGSTCCVGVLSVSDIAHWIAREHEQKGRLPQTCGFQEKAREPRGRETVKCTLESACVLQQVKELADGKECLVCCDARSVPTDWQIVELESSPGSTVRDYMTTTVITAQPTTPVPELTRRMLDNNVNSLIVLDASAQPIGVITLTDLLRALSHLIGTGDSV
jgi:CBS-domain-containing membrane protein